MTVIDFHGHVGRWDRYRCDDDVERRLRAMDAVGVDRACVFNIVHPDGRFGNDLTAQFVARRPDRFIGFAYVSPLVPETMVDELVRSHDVLGLRAIKLYAPSTPYAIDAPNWDPVYAFADARGLVVLHHTGPNTPADGLAAVAARFPRAGGVAGHAGNTPPVRAQVLAAAQACPNVYLETSSSFRSPGVVEELVAGAGAERVLFGSDSPLLDPRVQLGKIITAGLSAEMKRLVLGENARRILRL
jgi:predicted TIM-barrel fold metal-dependent hydrolase